MAITTALFCVCLFICGASLSNAAKCERFEVRTFPKDFLFGTSTASYQVEGAWNEDGKSQNIWDYLTHTNSSAIKDGSNGDVADDSYHKADRDVEIMRELGLDFYRFSISWTRIMPTSFPNQINEAGVAYYSNLIDEMLKYNIEPMVTLYHWDLPQRLQEMGGWANPYIVDWYGDYARVIFQLFGDRVKYFTTMNEPRQICNQGYGADTKAPRVNIPGIADYMCPKHLLLAHAKAFHIYDEEFRQLYNGSIFISVSAEWNEPESEEHTEAAERYNEFEWGLYTNPIFSEEGDFPQVVKDRIAQRSKEQGFPRSRLPEFTPEEVDYVKGSSDFFGLNHYTTRLVYSNESFDGYYSAPSFYDDIGSIGYLPSEWEGIYNTSRNKIVPWGFTKLLNSIREKYNNPPVLVTENGCATNAGLEDDNRIHFYYRYLHALLDALDEGSDIRGYTAWSIMDNFEWMYGYTERFGLYEVDYESADRTRTARKSAFVFKNIINTHTLDCSYDPEDFSNMTIDEGH